MFPPVTKKIFNTEVKIIIGKMLFTFLKNNLNGTCDNLINNKIKNKITMYNHILFTKNIPIENKIKNKNFSLASIS